MDCPKSLYLSIVDYCNGRKVRILNWEMDLEQTISKGCPQGSIFGPEFWDIIFDPLLKMLESESTVKAAIAYADDLLLLVEGETRSQLETKSCRAMVVVDSWCKILLRKASVFGPKY